MKRLIKKNLITLGILLFAFCLTNVQANAKSQTAVNMKVGSKTFKCVFYNNKTAKALLKKMPVKYNMSELNGNEKYKYLKKELPANEKMVKKIKAGDIMLYGSDCLVVFYKSFSTTYEYTPVGHVTNPRGLKKAVGAGSVTIQFSKKKAIALTQNKLILNPGKTKKIKLKGANSKKIRWSSSNKKVATVSKGKIKAKSPGKATIIAKYKNKKYKCKIIVRAVKKVTKQTPASTVQTPTDTTEKNIAEQNQMKEERKLAMYIGDKKVNVQWEDNESVAALKNLVNEKQLTVHMSMYGGFEQVGSIGISLPRKDVQTTTSAGDIVLYSGNQIVVFYGSNSWAYTRLGHITDQDTTGMKKLLGNGDVTITVSME